MGVVRVGEVPGTIERLNALPVGSIISDQDQLGKRPSELGANWRKLSVDCWHYYNGDQQRTDDRTLHEVIPSDVHNMRNLAHWHVHTVGVYLIEEEEDFQ